MLNLILKRITIISGLLFVLIALESITEDSLLLSVPSDLDIIEVLAGIEENKEELEQLQKDYIDAQDDLLQHYRNEINNQQQDQILDDIRQEEERLKLIEQQLKNAYMLNDRDGAQDYQNLFTDSIKHTFVIDFDTTEYEQLIENMEDYYAIYGSYKSNEYVKVDVTYTADDETIFIPDVGIRSKGNTSRVLPINNDGTYRAIHYVLKFNETFDTVEGTTEYEWLKKREIFDVEQLLFKWNKNYDPSFISEVYANRVFNDAGVIAANMTLAKYVVRIDGEVVSEELYSVQEMMDEEFIRKHFQETPTKEVGDLYKVVWSGTTEPISNHPYFVGIRDWENDYRPIYGKETNTNIEDFSNIIDFTHQLAVLSGTNLENYLEANFDMDNWLRSMAMNVLLGNPDDIRGNANNYYLYFDENDYLTYIPFDYDHCLGQGWLGGLTTSSDIYTWWRLDYHVVENIPLVDKVLEIEKYQIIYENYIMQFINDGIFSYAGYTTMFNTYQSLYGNEFSMWNDKENYFNEKIQAVTEDVTYYRNLRD